MNTNEEIYGCGCEDCTYNDPCEEGMAILRAEREQEMNDEWQRLMKEAEERIRNGDCPDCVEIMLDSQGFVIYCPFCKNEGKATKSAK